MQLSNSARELFRKTIIFQGQNLKKFTKDFRSRYFETWCQFFTHSSPACFEAWSQTSYVSVQSPSRSLNHNFHTPQLWFLRIVPRNKNLLGSWTAFFFARWGNSWNVSQMTSMCHPPTVIWQLHQTGYYIKKNLYALGETMWKINISFWIWMEVTLEELGHKFPYGFTICFFQKNLESLNTSCIPWSQNLFQK